MENDIQLVHDRFDLRISDLRTKLEDLIALRQSKIDKIRAYYEALAARDAADAVISAGKPIV